MASIEPALLIGTVELQFLRRKLGDRLKQWNANWAQSSLDLELSTIHWTATPSTQSLMSPLDSLLFPVLFGEEEFQPVHALTLEIIAKARADFIRTVFTAIDIPQWQTCPSQDWLTSVRLDLQLAERCVSVALAPEWVYQQLADLPSRKPASRFSRVRDALAPQPLALQIATPVMELRISELLDLSVGDVVAIEKSAGQPFTLQLGNTSLASGILCQQNNALAFNIQKWAHKA